MSDIQGYPQQGTARPQRRTTFTDASSGDAADVEAARAAMTRLATLRIAAGFIAYADFPKVSILPRLAALPFVNLGHVPLLDYDLLGTILWRAAYDLAALYRKWKKRRRADNMVMGACAGLVMIGIGVMGNVGSLSWIVAGLVYLLGVGVLRSRETIDERAADYRRQLIENLRAGRLPEFADLPMSPETRMPWGTGALGGEHCPVLVATPERRFPGYGREQGIETFVCPRDSESHASPAAAPHDPNRVYEAVLAAAAKCRVPHMVAGRVVVVEGDSLSEGSPWLDSRLCPRLWVSAEDVARVERWAGSARGYLAVQILLPDQATAATLFVRAFAAGGAAGVEVSLSTLGPPMFSDRYLSERVRQLGSHRRRRDFARYWRHHFWRDVRGIFLGKARDTTYITAMEKLNADHMRVQLDALSKTELATSKGINPLPEQERDALEYEGAEFRKHRAPWPGNWPNLWNWRERCSLLLPEGRFEGAETRAVIRAVYETIGSAILDALKDMGYDIAKYRDRDGKLSIHAEAIDSLVIGEKIVMEKGEPKPKKRGSREKSAPAQASAPAA